MTSAHTARSISDSTVLGVGRAADDERADAGEVLDDRLVDLVQQRVRELRAADEVLELDALGVGLPGVELEGELELADGLLDARARLQEPLVQRERQRDAARDADVLPEQRFRTLVEVVGAEQPVEVGQEVLARWPRDAVEAEPAGRPVPGDLVELAEVRGFRAVPGAVAPPEVFQVGDLVLAQVRLVHRDAGGEPGRFVGAGLLDRLDADLRGVRVDGVADPAAVEVGERVERAELDGVRDAPAARQDVHVRQRRDVLGVDNPCQARNVIRHLGHDDDVVPGEPTL
ncbi:hypothetical protein [Lentzea terrae]|uniref:hypothetical protein n=1 Tax=Lentzea terrae TaxID=2200761 RepID=UPI001E32C68C|nr:hypothetical protein [Lentzea terrae]